MKIVRSLDHVDTKKIDKLLEMEPELVALLKEHKTKKAAEKISRKIYLGVAVTFVLAIVAYVTFIANSVGGV